MLNRKNIDNLHATSHIQDRYPQVKKKIRTTLKIRPKNATAQTAHLFFPTAQKSQQLKKIKELFFSTAQPE